MDNIGNVIRNYKLEILDIRDGNELSEFETHYILHTRSELYMHYNSLTEHMKIELAKADLLLIQNAEKVYNHLSNKFDFNQFNQPLDEWWWHLDKLLDGNLRFESVRTVQSPIGKPARVSKGFAEVDLKIEEEKEK